MGLTNAISIVNWIFGLIIYIFIFLFIYFLYIKKNMFLLFFADFKLLMFHNNIVKISENSEQVELDENLHPNYQHVCSNFTMGKNENIQISPLTRV